jgi:hypothetical protein
MAVPVRLDDHISISLDITIVGLQKHKPFYSTISVSRIINQRHIKTLQAYSSTDGDQLQRKPPSVQSEPPWVPFPLLEVL